MRAPRLLRCCAAESGAGLEQRTLALQAAAAEAACLRHQLAWSRAPPPTRRHTRRRPGFLVQAVLDVPSNRVLPIGGPALAKANPELAAEVGALQLVVDYCP